MSGRVTGRHLYIDWSEVPLGDISDSRIAKALSMSVASVTNARRRRGMPAHPRCTDGGSHPCECVVNNAWKTWNAGKVKPHASKPPGFKRVKP